MCCSTGLGPSSVGGTSWTTVSPDATAVPHSEQNLALAGSFAPQLSHLARRTHTLLLGRLRLRFQRPQSLSDPQPQRANQLAVVLVGDLAGAVVELELLERRQCAVAVLGDLERALLQRAGLVQPVLRRIGLAEERKRDEQHAAEREHGPDGERERRHARA